MNPVSAALITKSLDGLSMRLDVTAANIANANSRTYRPSLVTFEQSLRVAATRGIDAINVVRPRVEAMPAARFGDEPRIDLDLDTAAATAGRYSALIEMLGREMEIARTAIRGGQQ
ncbi:flagellar basal body rod protein FlgB [uncultured Sphingomonas sp.]|uniref:flagellar basal body rod protein FlgB n=1 Tax=uncultured Sphingomonas sp. TaxID=158754 RepID=UPI0035CB582A